MWSISQAARWWTGVAILLFFLWAIAVAVARPLAAQDTARIVGRVTDGAGNAVAGARVVLVAPEAASPAVSTTTGETGGFQFAGLSAGTYTVRAERPGFAAREQRVTVEAGERLTVVARLRAERSARPALAEVLAERRP